MLVAGAAAVLTASPLVRWAPTSEAAVFGLAVAAVIVVSPLLLRAAGQAAGGIVGQGATRRRIPSTVARGTLPSARLAAASLRAAPQRAAAGVAPLVVGLAIVSFTLVQAATDRAQLTAAVSASYAGTSADYVIEDVDIPDGIVDRLDALPEVTAAGWRGGGVTANGLDAIAMGSRPRALLHIFDLDVTAGDLARLDDQGVAVTTELARSAHVEVGDTVTVEFFNTSTATLRLAAVFMPDDRLWGDVLVVPEVFTRHVPTYGGDSRAWIARADGVSRAAGEAALAAALQDQPQIRPVTVDESVRTSGEGLRRQLALDTAVLGLTIVVTIAGLANGTLLAALDRRRELALLRAVGATRRQLTLALCAEAVLAAVIAAVIAVLTGAGLAGLLVRRDPDVTMLAVPVVAIAVLTTAATTLVVITALLPARWASRHSVIDTFGRGTR